MLPCIHTTICASRSTWERIERHTFSPELKCVPVDPHRHSLRHEAKPVRQQGCSETGLLGALELGCLRYRLSKVSAQWKGKI